LVSFHYVKILKDKNFALSNNFKITIISYFPHPPYIQAFGFKIPILLSIKSDEVIINGEVDCDIDRFLKLYKSSKRKALILYRAEPFRTICYYHNWAEDIRDFD